MPLTPEQEAIVAHPPTSHARVSAGPGTGKSHTAVAYLERLTQDHPDVRARMLTFTRAATAEFAEKMGDADLAGLGVSPPGTVHSFALTVLLLLGAPGLPQPLRIPDTWEVERLIRPHMSRRLRARGHVRATASAVKELEEEMAAGWESLNPERAFLADQHPELGAAYVGEWSEHRRAFGYTLLAELPFRAGRALEDLGDNDTLELDLLIVDEFQDLNRADIDLILRVSRCGVTILAIGDEDQSIYSRRKADPEGIRRFCEEFGVESGHDYRLTQSRRCGGSILRSANQLIETAPDREAKPSLTPAPSAPDGEFAYLRFRTTEEEAEGVAGLVAKRIRSGIGPSEILILVRSGLSRWSEVLEPALARHDVSLAATDWVAKALETDLELRRWIALGRLAENRLDSLAWWTLLEGLTAGIGPAFTEYVYSRRVEDESFAEALLRLHENDFEDAPSARVRALELVRETRALLEAMDTDGVVLGERGWGGWLLDQEGASFGEEAQRLLQAVGKHHDPRDGGLMGFLQQLEPTGKDLAANMAGGVRLATMAQAKGLTVNTSIVLGVEDGLIPFPRGDINEERRLLYVAMTRATNLCVLTWSNAREGRLAFQGRPRYRARRQRSPLLADLPIGRWVDGETWVRDYEP